MGNIKANKIVIICKAFVAVLCSHPHLSHHTFESDRVCQCTLIM